MNFSYGVIIAVGILAAISIGFISMDPNQIIEPRAVSQEKASVCTMDWVPVCGIDGVTYGNACMLNAAGVEQVHRGECSVDDPIVKPRVELTPEPMAEPEPMVEPEPMAEPESMSMTAIVSVPAGSAVPGCEETDECYLPFEVNVAIGGTVSWINDDSAAHTVTSGIPGTPDGEFDSSLFMAGDVYEFTFDNAGTYDYYCMVHPWMIGIVNVN